jgi:flagellar FliJ protein
MKARESALRLKRFEADEKARKAADIEHMILEFEGMANDLDRQIKAEEERTGIKDPAHFAYSTFAKSASHRRDNLRASADGLKVKLEAAQRERDEALEQAALADAPATRGEMRSRRRADRSSSAALR